MKTLLGIAITALAACASQGLGEDDVLTQAPVVNEAAGRENRAGEPEARAALDAATQAFLKGDDRECLRILRGALEAGVPEPVAAEMRALRFDARRRLLSREVVEARIVPRRDFVTRGEDVAVALVLRNLGDEPLRVPVSDSGASDAVFVLDVTRTDYDIYGNVRTRSDRLLAPFPEDAEIVPGGRHESPFTLPAEDGGETHRGFTEVSVRGVFRPAMLRAGEESFYEAVNLATAVIRVFPEGWEPIAADPVGTISKAIGLDAPEHLLIAVELAPAERRRSTAATLLSALEKGDHPGLAGALCVALSRLTGQSAQFGAAAWIAWKKEGGLDGLR